MIPNVHIAVVIEEIAERWKWLICSVFRSCYDDYIAEREWNNDIKHTIKHWAQCLAYKQSYISSNSYIIHCSQRASLQILYQTIQ